MHAASVHPEPGSNSLKIYYIRFRVIYFVLELYLSFFYFLSFSQCVLTRFLYTICVRNSVVQFSKTDAQTGFSCQRLCYYTTSFCLCQDLFQNFFKFFQSFFDVSTSKQAVLSCGARLVYHFVFYLSSGFLKFF